jgi:hypothetical protein
MSRSANRRHDCQFFYKYVSAHTAKTVLATRKLRWSSPLLFNDPFDVTQEIRLNFTDAELRVAVAEEVARLVVDGGPPPDVLNPMLKALLNGLNEQHNPNLRREMADVIRRESSSGPTLGQIQSLADLRQLWSAIVPVLRVLCLSEVNDVTPMWLQYADQYRGVVLQFEALDEVDSVFLMARPVVYQDALPAIANRQAWVRCIVREGKAAFVDLITEYQYVKTTSWSHEREWRLATLARAGDSGLFSDWGFHPRELSGVYLGPCCSEQDERETLSLLSHGLEHVTAYRARIRGVAPKFPFEPVLARPAG